jgi:hypothetical protein
VLLEEFFARIPSALGRGVLAGRLVAFGDGVRGGGRHEKGEEGEAEGRGFHGCSKMEHRCVEGSCMR